MSAADLTASASASSSVSSSLAHRRLSDLVFHLSPPQPSAVSVSLTPLSASLTAASSARTLNRCVIVAGIRTPFIKSFSDLLYVDSINLGSSAVSGLLKLTGLDANQIDSFIFGNVVVNSASPNIAREILFDLNLPPRIAASTVSMACLSGLEAISLAAREIETGGSECCLAGGADSLSNGELTMPRRLTQALGKYSMGGGNKLGFAGYQQFFNMAGPISTWFPKPNSVAERVSGRTMGWHADMMAQLNKVPRKDQEEWAIRSHQNASKAAANIAKEIIPIKDPKSGKSITKDNLTRAKLDPAKLADLKPAFRQADEKTGAGTITAASSTALTDGASCVLLMSEKKAAALGYPTDVSIRSYVKLGYQPMPQLLLAPAVAIPRALERAGLTKDDIDVWELHEAFAAQTLVTMKVLEDPEWCKVNLGYPQGKAFGAIPREKVNPNGGSLAIGHPFAATGGRLVTSATNYLRREKKRYALISICAAGGLGGVMVLERQ